MSTEDWKPRYNDGQNNDGQNRERRPYNSNRTNYGNSQGGSYGRSQDNRGSYNRSNAGNYDRRDDGGYSRPKTSYNNRDQGGYNNRQSSGNYDRPSGYNNYSNGNYDRPQRSYDNSSSMSENGAVKKRRPRVGEVSAPARKSNYSNDRPNSNYNQGGYNSRGGYQSQRPAGRNNNPRYNNNNNNYRQRNDSYNPNAKYGVQKQLKYREEHFDPNELIRLNKYLANAGICSRREADEFIQAGLVKVNGEVVSELGSKVKRADQVVFNDQPVKLEQKIYVLLNKPKNCVTTADDPQERLTVMDLVKNACQERIFPVGRLDRNTTGVLLLTNDGDLSSKLTHPKFLKKKIYHVWLDKDVSIADMQKLAEGIDLDDGEIHADAVSYVDDEVKDQVGIEIHSGRNRIVRRMFESLGYHVIKLDRVYFAGLTKKNLKRGQWRYLNEREVSMLRMGAFE
ncbi:MAG: RNA-binding S4 domain-containing protein [Candidatus Azobacteroides sp.]|nr:RNA-binding S4 domain-containing protein [Candidatus Azobacteroides sp.]